MADPNDTTDLVAKWSGPVGLAVLLAAGLARAFKAFGLRVAPEKEPEVPSVTLQELKQMIAEVLEEIKAMRTSHWELDTKHQLMRQQVDALMAEMKSVRERTHEHASNITVLRGELDLLKHRATSSGKFHAIPDNSDG